MPLLGVSLKPGSSLSGAFFSYTEKNTLEMVNIKYSLKQMQSIRPMIALQPAHLSKAD